MYFKGKGKLRSANHKDLLSGNESFMEPNRVNKYMNRVAMY